MTIIDIIRGGEAAGQVPADIYVGHPADRDGRLTLQIGMDRYDLTEMAPDIARNLVKLDVLSGPDAARDVLMERQKQRTKWGTAHDDGYEDGELANAAAYLALTYENYTVRDNAPRWAVAIVDRTETRREDLIIAAALLLDEIERIDRMAR